MIIQKVLAPFLLYSWQEVLYLSNLLWQLH